MIATIFFAFLIIILLVIAIGQYIKSPVLMVAGFSFLFILGVILLTGAVSYETGSTQTYTYMCTVCGTPQIINYTCTGQPNACDYYDRNQTMCEMAGCIFNTTSNLCDGIPTACTTFTTQPLCLNANCTWNQIITNATVGINSTVIASTTESLTYSNYDNEIVAGIQIHHILGFLISILAAFGFVTTMTQLGRLGQ